MKFWKNFASQKLGLDPFLEYGSFFWRGGLLFHAVEQVSIKVTWPNIAIWVHRSILKAVSRWFHSKFVYRQPSKSDSNIEMTLVSGKYWSWPDWIGVLEWHWRGHCAADPPDWIYLFRSASNAIVPLCCAGGGPKQGWVLQSCVCMQWPWCPVYYSFTIQAIVDSFMIWWFLKSFQWRQFILL